MNAARETVLAAASGGLVALVLGMVMVPLLRRLAWGQAVRDDGPASHERKRGTPTMGGVLFLLALIPLVVFSWPLDLELALWLGGTLGFAAIGLLDDFLKVGLKRPLGLKARTKVAGQVAVALAFGYLATNLLGLSSSLVVPYLGLRIETGVLFPAVVVLVFMATANAVNLTDGLDGLAAGVIIPALLVFALLARALGLISLTLGAWALAGACLGFLWHNYHPARVMMGDTGSLGLGAALAGLAILTKAELLLVVSGGLLVLVTLSVIVQVASFQLTGRRVLKMAPLHHHFELSGWSELQVVHRFWLASWVFNCLAFLSLASYIG